MTSNEGYWPAFILLLPPTLGLCLTFGAPFISPPPSSVSILAVLRRRLLFIMLGDVFELMVCELVLCCFIMGCELGDGVCWK